MTPPRNKTQTEWRLSSALARLCGIQGLSGCCQQPDESFEAGILQDLNAAHWILAGSGQSRTKAIPFAAAPIEPIEISQRPYGRKHKIIA